MKMNDDGNTRLTKAFYDEALVVLQIYARMLDNVEIYQPMERKIVHSFDDREFIGEQDVIVKKMIIKYGVRYMAKYFKFKGRSDNGHIKQSLIEELNSIKAELHRLKAEDNTI